MAHGRLVELFLTARHDHLDAYAAQTRGLSKTQPWDDPLLLVAVGYEVEEFMKTVPWEDRTSGLRGRLYDAILKQVPQAPAESSRSGRPGHALRNPHCSIYEKRAVGL